MDARALRNHLSEYDLDHRADAILALARPCAWLSITRETSRSRLGGEPDLAPDLAWPQMDGRDLSFHAQIDLAEIRVSGLPRDGLLLFFYESSGEHDGVAPCRVLHVRGATARRSTPEGTVAFEQAYVRGQAGLSFPALGPGSPFLDPLELDEEERAAIHDWSSIVDEDLGRDGAHQLMGYPAMRQNDVLVRAAQAAPEGGAATLAEEARSIQLLLELSGHDFAGLAGDALSFVIRSSDLAAARFERAWSVLDIG